jgi:hypothetical protein
MKARIEVICDFEDVKKLTEIPPFPGLSERYEKNSRKIVQPTLIH